MRRVIVAGGQEFLDYAYLSSVLTHLVAHSDIIVSGCAPGADTLAILFAREHGYSYGTYPAHWNVLGNEAGKIRNTQMVSISDVLIAFWDGQSPGTRDTIHKALNAGLEVHVYRVRY